jgi:hypothetical protein
MPNTSFPPIHYTPLLLTQAELADPLSVISAFFADYDLPMATTILQQWLKAAFRYRALNHKKMLDTLELKDGLQRLLEAASLLVDKGESRLDPESGIALMDPAHYLTRATTNLTAFDCFPRSLNRDEYMDPYFVFVKTRHKHHLPQWREFLSDLWSTATTAATVYEVTSVEQPWTSARLLQKLLDASHLVLVREFHHDNGQVSSPQ